MTETEAATADVQRAVRRLSAATGQQVFTCCFASYQQREPCMLFGIRVHENGHREAVIIRANVEYVPIDDVVVLTGLPT